MVLERTPNYLVATVTLMAGRREKSCSAIFALRNVFFVPLVVGRGSLLFGGVYSVMYCCASTSSSSSSSSQDVWFS